MTYLAKPKLHHPALPTNELGYTRRDYEGPVSTLCAGCGHDSISAAIIQAFWQLAIPPHRGANLANRDLIYLGVSGDGDSASIGFGQFAHIVRRGVNFVYIVENNGVYGLTKGQFSATADKGSKSKKGVTNSDAPIDLVQVALQLGATFVARSFSGDKAQLVPLIEAAVRHKGSAVIDVVSPCVAFNNHSGSTKSYDYVRVHNESVNALDFMPARAPIEASPQPGTVQSILLHDGGSIRVRKLAADYDPHDRIRAMTYLAERNAAGELVTGLLFVEPDAGDLHDALDTVATPLNALRDGELVPGSAALSAINASLR